MRWRLSSAQNPDVQVVLNYASSLQLAAACRGRAGGCVRLGERAADGERGQRRAHRAADGHLRHQPADDHRAGGQPRQCDIGRSAGAGGREVRDGGARADPRLHNQMLEQMAADPTFGPVFVDAVYGNLASEESSVRQVVAKIELGEADAAVVYVSDVAASPPDAIDQIEIPEEYNVIASYPVGLITDAPNRDLGAAFIEFVLSEQGQAILAEWGFEPAAGG